MKKGNLISHLLPRVLEKMQSDKVNGWPRSLPDSNDRLNLPTCHTSGE